MVSKKTKVEILVLLVAIGIAAMPSAGASAEISQIVEGYALPGETIDAHLTLNATEPMGAIHLRIDYNPLVANITSVTQQNGFDVLVSNTGEGWIEFICYQTGAVGAWNTTFTFSIQAVGDYCTKTTLNTTVITLKNNTGSPMTHDVHDAVFRIGIKGDFSGDMDIDVWDCAYLCRYLIGMGGYEELCSGDLSGDGVLDSYDCTYLARKLVGLA
jgi:hypothetical protein